MIRINRVNRQGLYKGVIIYYMSRNLILFGILIVLVNILFVSLVGDKTLNFFILFGTELIKLTDFKINIFYLDYKGFLIACFLLLNIGFLLIYLKLKNDLIRQSFDSIK